MIRQQKKSVNAGEKIPAQPVETLIREYKKTRWVSNSERLGKPDSLSAWYSLRDVEEFLAAVKSNGGDGIKFYFAAYPDDYAAIPEYEGRQTLIPVATRSKMTISGVAQKDLFIRKNGKADILCINFPPGLCPPLCNSNAEGGTGGLGITIIDKEGKGMEII